MKLIICLKCHDVYKLSTKERRSCYCAKTWGQYMPDGLVAEVSDNDDTQVLGLLNNSLAEAVILKRRVGDLPDGTGHRFIAFVMPDANPNVKRVKS